MAVVNIDMCISLINREDVSIQNMQDQIERINKYLESGNFNQEDDRVTLHCLRDDLINKILKIQENYPRLSG